MFGTLHAKKSGEFVDTGDYCFKSRDVHSWGEVPYEL